MRLTEAMDFINRSLAAGRHCYMVSFDIKGAFDNVSHIRFMDGLARMGVDYHIRRVTHNWLPTRTFQVKMRTPRGACYSRIYPITEGLPQGRVLSPLLRIIFFDLAPRKLGRRRQGRDNGGVWYRGLILWPAWWRRARARS